MIIASRESALAMWQAEHVQALLRGLYPRSDVSILGMTTRGDQILDSPLAKIGGKGLFVKELEVAMEEGRADLAVHSMKDVPMLLPEGFVLAATGEREDPRDAFVSNDYADLAELPKGAVVGTSSLRRQSQIKVRFPHLEVAALRGNVQTRLRRLDEGRFAAILLAAAGLRRLGLESRITRVLTPEESLPAVGQGALGIECRADRADLSSALAPLNHRDTELAVRAERAMSRRLAGSCQVPLGGYATIGGNRLHLRGFVADPDGRRYVEAEAESDAERPEALGERVGEALLAKGAAQILADLESAP